MAKRIETEEQYETARKWLTEQAARLENPGHPFGKMTDHERKHLQAVYDATFAECDRFRHEQYVNWKEQRAKPTPEPDEPEAIELEDEADEIDLDLLE